MRKEYTVKNTKETLEAIQNFMTPISTYRKIVSLTTFDLTPGNIDPYIIKFSDKISYNYLTYYDTVNGLYLTFFDNGQYVGLSVSTEFEQDKSVYDQKGTMLYNYTLEHPSVSNSPVTLENITIPQTPDLVSFTDSVTQVNSNKFIYTVPMLYIPIKTKSVFVFIGDSNTGVNVGIPIKNYSNNTLVANYNEDGNFVMFSIVFYLEYPQCKIKEKFTSSILFGTIDKYFEFEGGFIYGGDLFRKIDVYYVTTNNRFTRRTYYGEGADREIRTTTTDIVVYRGSKHTVETSIDFAYDLHLMLFANIDAARDRIYTIDISLATNSPNITLKNIITTLWCSTIQNQYTVQMVSAISEKNTSLPTYWPVVDHFPQFWSNGISYSVGDLVIATGLLYKCLVSHTSSSSFGTDLGRNYWEELSFSHIKIIQPGKGLSVNTLNDISSVMPLYLIVKRDPAIINNFSPIGNTDVINYVNMFNIGSNKILEKSFPDTDAQYNCFNIGYRRVRVGSGMKGYSGIAFKLGTDRLIPPIYPEPEKPSDDVEKFQVNYTLDTHGCITYSSDPTIYKYLYFTFEKDGKSYTSWVDMTWAIRSGGVLSPYHDSGVWAWNLTGDYIEEGEWNYYIFTTAVIEGNNSFDELPDGKPTTNTYWAAVITYYDQNCKLIDIKGSK